MGVTVPGPPASVLAAVLRADAAHPYSAAVPAQRRLATFTTSPSFPDLPSLMTEVVFLPQNAVLDANVAVTGTFASQGWGTQGVASVTAAYTAGPSDAVILANATSGPFTVTLPDATQAGFVNPGQRYTVIKTDSSGSTVTVAGSAGQKISGAASVSLTGASSYTSVVFDGANWQTWAGYTLVGTSPTGSAGGDLGGTYPSPTVTGTHLASPLPIAQGGTAAGTATAALSSLGAAALAGAAFTGEVGAPDFSVSGLTGAAAGTRYAGATTGGAPASGTFSTGDVVTDQSGAVQVCTAGGTPGTWVKVAPPGAWHPSDNGLLVANFDIDSLFNSDLCTAGTVYLMKLIIRYKMTITDLYFAVQTAASGTSAGTYAGLYSSAGTLLSGSADVASSFTAGNGQPAQCALTTPQPLAAGTFVWAALLTNFSVTQPTLYKSLAVGSDAILNMNLATATYRFAVNGTSRTTLPSPVTPSSNTQTGAESFWVGGA